MNPPEIPKRMQHLPLFRGLPIPYANFIGPDGQPDFKVLDHQKHQEILREKLCGICGGPLGRGTIAFIGGEGSIKSSLFTDPAMHVECARYAAKVCPYLNNGSATYSSAPPKHLGQGDFVHKEFEAVNSKRPKRMGIYFTNGYKYGQISRGDPMIYIKANPPLSIDWTAMPESPDPPAPKPEPKIVNYVDEDGLTKVIQSLPNGQGVQFVQEQITPDGRNPGVQQIALITSEDLRKLNDDLSRMHIISCELRVGDSAFFQSLEFDWFTPGTPLNDDFHYRIFKWQDLIWEIASVPIEKKEIVYETAKNCRMRIGDGVPHLFSGDSTGEDVIEVMGHKAHLFPLNCKTAYSLENAHGSKVYEGPGGVQDERIRERFDINQVQERYRDGTDS